MSNLDELKDHKNAIEYLSARLMDGSLVLFLGAGASKGFGLPNWVELVNGLRCDCALDPLDEAASADQLQSAADEVTYKLKDQIKLLSLIEKHLYNDFKSMSHVKAFNNHLLVSISALLMGSKRGHVTRVVTLNYDSMLEWFLSLFGFVVKTVHKLPELEGSEDVRIYHPHGFVPIPGLGMKKSDFVILDMHSANQRLGDTRNAWFELTRHILDTGICLFIGMSGNTLSDRIIAPLLAHCGPKCEGKRPLGIWILKDVMTKAKEIEFERYSIVPIQISDEEKISEFLLEICQSASKKLLKK